MTTTERLTDILLAAWFVLVALAFWGPNLGIALPTNVSTALYGVFLLWSASALALRVVRQTQPEQAQPKQSAPAPKTTERRQRHGK